MLRTLYTLSLASHLNNHTWLYCYCLKMDIFQSTIISKEDTLWWMSYHRGIVEISKTWFGVAQLYFMGISMHQTSFSFTDRAVVLMWDYEVTENQSSGVRSWKLREAPLPLDFLTKKISGMYIIFIIRLNNTVLASFADRLVFMLLLSR